LGVCEELGREGLSFCEDAVFEGAVAVGEEDMVEVVAGKFLLLGLGHVGQAVGQTAGVGVQPFPDSEFWVTGFLFVELREECLSNGVFESADELLGVVEGEGAQLGVGRLRPVIRGVEAVKVCLYL
jgi:hypothetical protein